MNKYRLADHLMTLGTALTGFAVGNVLPVSHHGTDAAALVVGLGLWGLGVIGVNLQGRGTVAEVVTVPDEPRRIPNLNDAPAPNGFRSLREVDAYQSTVKVVKQRDARLQQWAYAVAYNNAPMIQKKWCGGKRLFSKPEYERWICMLLEKSIVTFVNPKNQAGGYKPNGAQGWRMIKDIADGRVYLPLPSAVLSQEQTRFVSARMRDGLSVGEGAD